MRVLIVFIMALCLSGCTIKQTDVAVFNYITGNGSNASQNLSDSTFRHATDMASDGRLALAQPGGVAGTGDQFQPKATSTTDIDHSKQDSDNPVTTTTSTTTTNNAPVVVPDDEKPKTPTKPTIGEKKDYYHHTFAKGESSGFYQGKLTMKQCDTSAFDSCTINGKQMKNAGPDEGGILWYAQETANIGDVIVCSRGDKLYNLLVREDSWRGCK